MTVTEPGRRVTPEDFNDIPSFAEHPLPPLEDSPFADNGDEPAVDPGYIPFAGLTHAEVLALDFPEERMLVKDLIPVGAVGTIAGVPETYKSWQAQTIAVGVAAGEGSILGHDITHEGHVGYFWQDDSTREEAERIKLYHRVRGTAEDLQVRWFLNEGLKLPEHLERLRTTIEHYDFVLVVLDSFYNVLFGADLKDDEAERVISMLKSEVCDPTGCTVLIVDHMPWATDQNRKRLRAYGGVFKGAAIRFGIYIDADANKLYVEARGNNITGFKRQPAEWDEERLELKLLDTEDAVSPDEYEQRIVDHLTENGWTPTKKIETDIKGRGVELRAARTRLEAKNALLKAKSRDVGLSLGGYAWNLAETQDKTPSPLFGTPLDVGEVRPASAMSPLRGDDERDAFGNAQADAEPVDLDDTSDLPWWQQ